MTDRCRSATQAPSYHNFKFRKMGQIEERTGEPSTPEEITSLVRVRVAQRQDGVSAAIKQRLSLLPRSLPGVRHAGAMRWLLTLRVEIRKSPTAEGRAIALDCEKYVTKLTEWPHWNTNT